jgi:nickel-dependent lactate racemase
MATGLVEPHFMAGWSGGRKVIAPGIAHADTITTFHSARFMEDPAATSCVLTDNPLHEEQLAIVEMIGGAHALNTVIDDERRLSFVNFGEILASHDEAVAHVRQYAQVALPQQFSTVVTTCAGFPLDGTYYQTVKGMVAALDILAPGGDLIIASSCSEGMGSQHFVDAQRRLVERGPDQFLVDITAKRFADIDEWQTEKLLAPLRIGSVKLFAEGLGATDGALTGVDVIDSVEAAVAGSVERHNDRRVAVVPEGPYVIPVYRPSAA